MIRREQHFLREGRERIMSRQFREVARAAILAACAVLTLDFLMFRFSPQEFQPSALWMLRGFLRSTAKNFHTAPFAGFWVFYYVTGHAALPAPSGIRLFHGVFAALWAAAIGLGKSYELLKSWDLLFAARGLVVLDAVFFAAAAAATVPALAFFDALIAQAPQPSKHSRGRQVQKTDRPSAPPDLPEQSFNKGATAAEDTPERAAAALGAEEAGQSVDTAAVPLPAPDRPPLKGRRARFCGFWRELLGTPFRRSCAAFFAFHLFWLLAFYPGSGTADTLYQFSQWLGVIPMNARHPPAATALMGCFLSLGQLLGDQNAGVFLYNFLQTAFQSFVFAQCVETVSGLTQSRALRRFTLLWLLLNPLFPTWSASCVKDSLYSASLLWFMICLVRLESGLYIPKSRIYLQLWLAATLAASLRLNGPAVIVAALTLFAFFRRPAKALRLSAIALLAAGVSVVPFLCLEGPRRYTALREALSLPLQQTARVIREKRTISAADRHALDQLFHGRDLSRIYDPELAAPVKWAWGDDGRSLAEWKKFLKIWCRLMKRCPADFLQAAFSGWYGYFYPNFRAAEDQSDMADFVPHERLHGIKLFLRRSGWGAARNALLLWTEAIKSLPVTGLVYNCAFYVWTTMFLAGTALFRRKYGVLPVAVPMLLTLASSLFGSINGCMRYLLPMAAALPLLLTCVVAELNGDGEGTLKADASGRLAT